MGLVLTDPPSDSPVSLAEAKRQCRVIAVDTNFDEEIQGYIDSAVAYLEGPKGFLGGTCLSPQSWDLVLDVFTDTIEIPLRPVIEVESVKYLDGDGVEQTLSEDAYTVDRASPSAWIVLNSGASWPGILSAVNVVRVSFDVGYEDAIPGDLKQAILLLVAGWFANKESVVIGATVATLPLAFEALCGHYRTPTLR